MTAFEADEVLADVCTQTDALLESVHALGDADVTAPSRCPGWTRGHVITHLARNADACARLLGGAAMGEQWPMYHDSPSRDEEIESGAGRPASALEADVEAAAERFLAVCAGFPEPALTNPVRMRDGRALPASQVPWLRWREVVLHHVDLDVGYHLSVVSAPLVERCLSESLARLAARDGAPALAVHATDSDRRWTVGGGELAVSGRSAALLGWVTGRSDGAGLDTGGASLPELPPWG